jgi:ABC-type maltose transport system permease subunit
MLLGRIVWGCAQYILLGAQGTKFTWQMFAAGAFINAIPGIILHLVLIPAIVYALEKAGYILNQGERK